MHEIRLEKGAVWGLFGFITGKLNEKTKGYQIMKMLDFI